MADPFFSRSQIQSGMSNEYKSPLEKTLADLRRKYVAAAGPQVGGLGSQDAVSTDAFLMEYSLLPSTSSRNDRDINLDVNMKHLGEEDYVERRKSMQMGSNSSMIFRGRRASFNMMSMRGSNTYAGSSNERLGSGSGSNLSPRSSFKKAQAASHSSENQITSKGQVQSNSIANSFLDQRADFLECATRYRSGVASTCHAENLIACAPHLRHISPASTDMQGNGSSSRNPIAAFIMKKSRSGEGTAESGGNRVPALSDHESCVTRKLANRRVALELATFVQVLANEMSLEEFTVVEGEIFSQILLFMHSNDDNKRLAGVAAIYALIGATSADEEKKITKVAKNLSDSLFKASNVDYEFLSEVTNALGKMALGAANVDYVESVVKRVPEWLKRDRSDRRLAAVLTVKELAKNAPAAFYSKTNQSEIGQEGGTSDFIAQIFPVLTDEQPVVRVCAADALAECLKVIVDPSRKHHSTNLILGKVFSFIMQVFKEQSNGRRGQRTAEIAEVEARQHVALLVIGDLLDLPLDFMLPRFDEVCKAALALRGHSKALIRLEVVRLIPRLARRCPSVFRRRYLGESLKYVMSAAKDHPPQRSGIDLRPTAYFALGQLALAVCEHESGVHYVPKMTLQFDLVETSEGSNNNKSHGRAKDSLQKKTVPYHMKAGDIYSNIKEMFTLIREGLETVRTEALHCGADVIEALGEEVVKPYIDSILNNMFQSGLSDDLISCLRSIAGSLPSKAYDIENRLLQELSLSLAGTTAVKEICDPLFALPFDADFDIYSDEVFIAHRHRPSPSISINMQENTEAIMKLDLSLRTLRSFGNIQSRKGLSLLPFVRDAVAQYLSHPSKDVRKEAALTCCFLLLPSRLDAITSSPSKLSGTENSALGTSSIILLEEVLQKLLRVAVSDSSPVVRHCIVKAFDERYDSYLCQTHHLPPLFLLMQDEALSVRSAALGLLGRLTGVNPGLVLPEMRRILIQLITELKCGEDTGCGKEAATRLLIVFFRATALHRLVHPFLHSIIAVLPLRGNAPRVTAAALDALAELARVVKDELKPWMHQLIPHIMETMQDQTSINKQRTSFRTLGVLAGSTGYVVDPYLDYPRLLKQAAIVLHGSKRAPWALRQEVIRTFGILGAINPDRSTPSGSSGSKSGGLGSGYFINPEDNILQERNKYRSQLASVNSISRSFSNARRIQNASMSMDGRFLSNDKVELLVGVDEQATLNISTINENEDEEPAHLYMYELYAMTARPISKISPARRLTPIDEEFYPTVALQALTSILKNTSLGVYHQISMQAIMFIFDSLGLRCVPFLKGIVPHILFTARTCGQITLREALLKQIARLSSIVKDNLRPYVPAIFEVIEEFWDSKNLATILYLIEKIASGVPTTFREYVSLIITRFLSTLDDFQSGSWAKKNDKADAEFNRLKLVLDSIRNLRENLVEYIHILLPALLKLTDSLVNPSLYFGISSAKFQPLAIDSITTVSALLQTKTTSSLKGQTEQMPALAAQPLIRLLGGSESDKEVGVALIKALCICARKIGKTRWLPLYHLAARNAILSWYRRFDIPPCDSSVDKDHTQCNVTCSANCSSLRIYDDLIKAFISSPWLFFDEDGLSDKNDSSKTQGNTGVDSSSHAFIQDALNPIAQPTANQINKHKVSQANLQRAWDVSQKTTREDWDEWMRHFAIQLLREAPAPALRATAELAYAYQPLARELFSAAFACCWSELSGNYRADLVQSLKVAFFADASPEILQTLLNLAEYAERDGIPGGLPIEIDVLAELALKCRSYAKALHYKEKEHELGGGGSCIEDLITINRKLDLPEAALGVLKSAQFEQERSGAQPWDRLYHSSHNNRTRTEISSRIFHRHRGEGLAYSVLSTANEIAARGSGAWDGVEMQESWLAKLGAWSDALSMYERKLEEDPSDVKAVLGCMNCLNARGGWKRVLQLSNRSFNALTANDMSHRDWRKAIKFCAQASWRLGQWDDLEKYSASLLDSSFDQYSGAANRADFDGCFFSAILNIHRKNWSVAAGYLDNARRSMDSRFTALMAESRKRAYPSMVTAQTLAEMEEIIAFRKLEERASLSINEHPTNKEDEKDARVRLIALWRKRLAGCRVDAEVHSSILAVRSLVLGPTDEVDATLTLSALSRQAQKYKLCEGVLLEPLKQLGADLDSSIFGFHLPNSLNIGFLNVSSKVSMDPKSAIDMIVSEEASSLFPEYMKLEQQYCTKLVSEAGSLEILCVQHKLYFAFVNHLWIMNNRDIAMDRLTRLANVVDLVAHTGDTRMNELRVNCWLKLAEWKIATSHTHDFSLPQKTQCDVLMALKRATFENNNGYNAWHTWALTNFRLAQQHDEHRHNILRESDRRSISRSRSNSRLSKTLLNHISAAVKGFVKAICLGTKRWSASVQQDLLHLLTCLFRYGQWTEVAKIIKAETGAVAIEAWLGVLPQLLARIHMKSPSVRSVLHPLLTRLGRKHPQALMYPLSVLVKSPVIERKEAAEDLMNSLKKHSYALVEDALMVSSELIRVAILWLELWHEGLEDASRLYFGEGNVSGMLDVLLPLHEELERGPSTRREQDFHQKFGRDLVEAYAYVKEYVRLVEIDGGKIPTQGGFMNSNEGQHTTVSHARQKEEAESAMNAAWDLYYTVFRKINKQLPGLTTLELSSCSPALLQAHNLELGVPGSYRVNGSFVKIETFYPSIHVITSKQRPRKIVLRGGDGKDYVFLLKGHEDLRQDERVMQLFGLVNALLARDRRTNNHDLNIQRYCITPLSHNAGVVGWVPHCDTLHSLIRDYRASKRIPLNMENREMLKLAQDYELLTVMQKVEIFSEALERTNGKGNDIHDVLWTKSTNSEEWLDRRTKFTRSIAVMSMVGYILGLGDRHPSNLMLDQISGRVLHIDFGDCFEVAMHREKYPEKVPFRLTRMLIKAMEVSGIEGSYRDTCERTMTVLRDNRDSLVAMLDAFVYDPLISWRLLGQSPTTESENTQPYNMPISDTDGNNNNGGLHDNIAGSTTHGRSIMKSRNAPIREEIIEEDGSGTGSTEHDPRTFLKPLSETSFIERRISTETGSLHSSQRRSLKMYSEIQSLASNLNMSSRIASITGDGSIRHFLAESVSRSRLDRSVRQREVMSIVGDDVGAATEEALNEKALKVIRRVQDKLTGTDFHPPDDESDPLDVQDQVQRLIVQATSTENLCQLFIGWCAFW